LEPPEVVTAASLTTILFLPSAAGQVLPGKYELFASVSLYLIQHLKDPIGFAYDHRRKVNRDSRNEQQTYDKPFH
jgi:hypothetical protein